MDTIILDSLPCRLEVEQLKKTLRIKGGSGMGEKVEAMAREAEAVARPKACYRAAYVESKGEQEVVIGGVKFSSRVLRVNLEKVFRVFPYVVTCGLELDQWSKSVEGIVEQYWAETIMIMTVRSTIRYLHDHLMERYQTGELSRMGPGSLPDWPLPEQKPLFATLENAPASIGVELRDSFLMTPVKSASGIFFPNEEGYENCQLCSRQNCPGRRAPYDQALWDRKYR